MIEAVITIPSPETPYAAHQAVWNLVGRDSGASRDFLFRVRDTGRPGVSLVKLRSCRLPVQGVEVVAPVAGGLYRFSVLVNPVRRGDRGERPLRREGEVREWLNERLERGGMVMKSCVVEFLPSVELGKPQHRGRIHTVEIIGTVEIVDADKAFHTLTHGIGRARSMGYGLIELEVCHG